MFGSRKTGFFTTSGGGTPSTNSQDLSETLGYGNQSSTTMLLVDDINAPTETNSISTSSIILNGENTQTLCYYRPDLMLVQDDLLNTNGIYANFINLSYNDGEFEVRLTPPTNSLGNLNFDTDANLYFPVPKNDGTTGFSVILAINNTPFIETISLASSSYTFGLTRKNSTYIIDDGGSAPNSIILTGDIEQYIKLYFLSKNTGHTKFEADTGYTLNGNGGAFNNQTGIFTIIRIGNDFFIDKF